MNTAVQSQSPDTTAVRVGLASEFPPAILDDYFRKRETWYVERRGIPDYNAGRDAVDDLPSTLIVLASDGQECLGGVRLTVHKPDDSEPFASELLLEGSKVRDIFPELDLRNRTIGEMSKLLIASRDGGLPFDNRILLRIAIYLLDLNRRGPRTQYAILTTPTRYVPIYQQIAKVTRLPFYTYPFVYQGPLRSLGDGALQIYQLPL